MRLLLGFLVVALAGCDLQIGRRYGPAVSTFEPGDVRVGQQLPLSPAATLARQGGALTFTFTNKATGATATRRIPPAEFARSAIRIDPSELPGLDPASSASQHFAVRVENEAAGYEETTLTVLPAPCASAPPRSSAGCP